MALVAADRICDGGFEVLQRRLAELTGMRGRDGRHGAIAEELRAVLLRDEAEADRLPRLVDHGVAAEPVEPESGNVEDILSPKQTVGACVVVDTIDDLPVASAVRLDPIRRDRKQRDRVAGAIALDFSIGVAPGEEMGLERLARDDRGHFGIELIVENSMQTMGREPIATAAR